MADSVLVYSLLENHASTCTKKKQRCIFVQYARFSLQIRQKQNEHLPCIDGFIYCDITIKRFSFVCQPFPLLTQPVWNSSRLLLLETLHHNSLGLFWTKTYWLVWSQDAFLVLFTVLNIETSSTPSSLGHCPCICLSRCLFNFALIPVTSLIDIIQEAILTCCQCCTSFCVLSLNQED